MKRQIALLLGMILLVAAVAGCSSSEGQQESGTEASQESGATDAVENELPLPELGDSQTEFAAPELLQLGDAPVGNPTATLHTTMGDIKLVLYPEQAPNTVENFLTLAEEGYYDGISFHRVINDFMIQGGDPTGTGAGGESASGQVFADEFSDQLHNFRGALSMANSGTNSNSSQFFIVQTNSTITEEEAEQYVQLMYQQEQVWIATNAYMQAVSEGANQATQEAYVNALNEKLDEVITAGVPENQKVRFESAVEAYLTNGGTPHLDYKHTVFGHVIEGMDIVDAIAATPTEGEKPVEDVLINSITIGEVA